MILGIEHVGGDMFESVPKADAILLKVYVFLYFIESKTPFYFITIIIDILAFNSTVDSA